MLMFVHFDKSAHGLFSQVMFLQLYEVQQFLHSKQIGCGGVQLKHVETGVLHAAKFKVWGVVWCYTGLEFSNHIKLH